nr:MAG: hypothetical protein DIU78_13610 [Pseudomonadota bacterium]
MIFIFKMAAHADVFPAGTPVETAVRDVRLTTRPIAALVPSALVPLKVDQSAIVSRPPDPKRSE